MNAIFRHQLFCVSLLACAFTLGCGPTDTVTPVADNSNQTQTDNDPQAGADTSADKSSNQSKQSKPGMAGMGMSKMKFPAPADMKFKDKVDTNAKAPKNVGELVFTNANGTKIKMADFAGKKNVMLVFTEGFNGMLCPFCQTQTSRLVSNYDKFKERDCEVIVVYPGSGEHLDEFVEAALKTEKEQVDKVPFPIVLDKDFSATNFFDINSKLAHPSTYLIDKQGAVKFAYVGSDMTADRPSIKAMLQRLDQLQE